MKTTAAACSFMFFLAFGMGCAESEGHSDDVGTDPDLAPDEPDVTDVTDNGTEGDMTEDVGEEEGPPVTCSGPDTLRLEFRDWEENPVEGIPVALGCASEVFESSSDGSGIVSFDNLDLEAIPVDLTYIHDGRARSILGLGGDRVVPDPFPLTVGEEEEEETVLMRGAVVHAEEDSYVIVSTDMGVDITVLDDYELTTVVGTGLPMGVLEYTSTGSLATPIGYSQITYDSPSEGESGPEASAASTTFQNATVTLNFDIRSDSPLRNRLIASDEDVSPNRTYTGIRIWAADANDRAWLAGLTTHWNKGDAVDTLEVAWAGAALDAAADVIPGLLVLDPNFFYYVSMQLPEDPSGWTSFTVHDTPRLPGFTASTTARFDQVITVEHPEWASIISYHVRLSGSSGVLGHTEFLWSVVTHPETVSFTFAGLPWPSSVPYSEILPSLTKFVGISGSSYDADPYEDYILWTDDEWASDHFQSVGVDSRFRIEGP